MAAPLELLTLEDRSSEDRSSPPVPIMVALTELGVGGTVRALFTLRLGAIQLPGRIIMCASHATARHREQCADKVSSPPMIRTTVHTPKGTNKPSGPYRTFTILKEHINSLPSKLPILNQLAVLSACQPVVSANPETTVMCGKQASNVVAWEMLAVGGSRGTFRTPSKGSKPNSVPSQR
jgi:hypothetical protein